MKVVKKTIIISIVSIISILIFSVFVFGITTELSSEKIENNDLSKCKEIVSIINRNKEFIKDSISKEAVGGTCIRYSIYNRNDVVNLFSKINNQDRKRFIELIDSKFCKSIEISEPKDCVMFLMKTSRKDWKIIGKYKKLFIIYENKPNCNCKDNPIGYPNFPDYVKKIDTNWYLTRVEISKRHFGC